MATWRLIASHTIGMSERPCPWREADYHPLCGYAGMHSCAQSWCSGAGWLGHLACSLAACYSNTRWVGKTCGWLRQHVEGGQAVHLEFQSCSALLLFDLSGQWQRLQRSEGSASRPSDGTTSASTTTSASY
eukprot:500875-Amphidinium_carterae.2